MQSTRITDHYENLPDNIFSKLPQIMIVPSVFANPSFSRFNFCENGRSNFHHVNFFLDYFSVDPDDTFKITEENIDYSTEAFLNKINNLLECYAPFKKSANIN